MTNKIPNFGKALEVYTDLRIQTGPRGWQGITASQAEQALEQTITDYVDAQIAESLKEIREKLDRIESS